MNKKKISVYGLILFVLLSWILPVKAVAITEEDPYYEKIKERGELIVGLTADYPPNEFHATVDGKDQIVGSDIYLAQKIADDLGVQLKIEEMGFDALLGAMKTGKIDVIISAMEPTPERLKEVHFSDPYAYVQQKVIVRKEDADKFHTVDDFEGMTVGAQKQSTEEVLVKEQLTGAKLTSLPKATDLILNLQNNKVDAIVIEGPVGEAYVSQNSQLAIADIEFEESDVQQAIAFPKNAPILEEKINQSIAEVHEQDLMKEYVAKAGTYLVSDGSFFQKYSMYYLKGASLTILLAVVGVVFGSLLGCLLALMKLSHRSVLKWIAIVYIEYVRGTPLLVQLFMVYFGTAVIGLELSALASGCIALALNSGAYVAEIVRAGIQGVDKGQLEAARSLGMSQRRAMYFVILPQAVKNILPALGNEFVTVIKESSIVSIIGVSELMFQAGVVQGASFKPFLPIVVVSIIYFILTFTISRLLGVAERGLRLSD